MKLLHSNTIKKISASILGTIFINFFFWATINIDFLNPGTATFNDIDLTDIVTSKLRPDDYLTRDTNIVLINIAQTRDELAKQIKQINRFSPKIIAVDALLEAAIEKTDTSFINSLASVKNIVLGNRFSSLNNDASNLEIIRNTRLHEMPNLHFGFANLPAKNTSQTIRSYLPFVNYKDSLYSSFSTEILKLVDTASYKYLLDREKEAELINYRGNNSFYKIEMKDFPEDVLGKLIKNKIVLLGYMGGGFVSDSLDCTDKFYTPLNPKHIGRSLPDMYGVEIHANILSMTLNKNYIAELHPLLFNLLIFALLFLNFSILFRITSKFKVYYNIIFKTFILSEAFILFFVYVIINIYFSISIDIKIIIITLFFISSFYDTINNIFHFFIRRGHEN